MSENKSSSILSRIEFLLIAAFFLGFVVWSVSKCGRTRGTYEDAAAKELADSLEYEQQRGDARPAPDTTAVVARTSPTQAITPTRERYTVLYVAVEGLNVRSEPKISARLLDRLPLYEEVEFMNQTTDSLEEISLGAQTFKAPWVKIKTRKGREGWVFGGAVSYYKTRVDK